MSDPNLALLAQARLVLERYMFDGDECRDDIAEICMKIDDRLPGPAADVINLQRPSERAA